jgi:tetratricopeptide (TPR) repeat protein
MAAQRIASLLFFIVCSASTVFPRQSIALFPLQNRSGEPLLDWVGYAVPELCFRGVRALGDAQIWDPIFLFSADSSAWRLDSLPAIKAHASRWRWDRALGGTYNLDSGGIVICVRIVQREKDNLTRSERSLTCSLDQCRTMIVDSIRSIVLGQERTSTSGKNGLPPAIATGNADTYAAYSRGYGYEMFDAIPAAVSAYSRAIDLDPTFTPAYTRIGSLYASNRMFPAARIAIDSALKLMPSSSTCISRKAEFLLDYGTPEEAQAFIQQKRALLEKSVEGITAIGRAYILSGEYERAIATLTRALAGGPSDFKTDLALGQATLAAANYDQAIEIFFRLTELYPRNQTYPSILATAFRSAGKHMESCSVLENALRKAVARIEG